MTYVRPIQAEMSPEKCIHCGTPLISVGYEAKHAVLGRPQLECPDGSGHIACPSEMAAE